ncbi:MAG: hypothetical protein WC823_05025 [Parcubacteria group bacterium]|jgi:hypothetical protein
METLKKLEWEEYSRLDLKGRFGILNCESLTIFQLGKDRLIACRSWLGSNLFRDLPYGDNTQVHVLSLLNLVTGKSLEIDRYYSNQWNSSSKKFKSNEDWCKHCLEVGKVS